jgi:hypothetical protein
MGWLGRRPLHVLYSSAGSRQAAVTAEPSVFLVTETTVATRSGVERSAVRAGAGAGAGAGSSAGGEAGRRSPGSNRDVEGPAFPQHNELNRLYMRVYVFCPGLVAGLLVHWLTDVNAAHHKVFCFTFPST